MRVLHVAAVLASCGMPMPAIAQDEATWASRLDYTLNESRDKPIICKQGDIERHAGQTLAQVFAEKWPVQPEPLPGSERVQAQATRAIRPRGAMRGMPVQPGIVVFAVLVKMASRCRRKSCARAPRVTTNTRCESHCSPSTSQPWSMESQ